MSQWVTTCRPPTGLHSNYGRQSRQRFGIQWGWLGPCCGGVLGHFALDGAEISGHCTDGSWFTVESSYFTWQRLGEPGGDQFGVTALDDASIVTGAYKDVMFTRSTGIAHSGCFRGGRVR
jgi:hypothetical protein